MPSVLSLLFPIPFYLLLAQVDACLHSPSPVTAVWVWSRQVQKSDWISLDRQSGSDWPSGSTWIIIEIRLMQIKTFANLKAKMPFKNRPNQERLAKFYLLKRHIYILWLFARQHSTIFGISVALDCFWHPFFLRDNRTLCHDSVCGWVPLAVCGTLLILNLRHSPILILKIGLRCVHVWLMNRFLTCNPAVFPLCKFGYNRI